MKIEQLISEASKDMDSLLSFDEFYVLISSIVSLRDNKRGGLDQKEEQYLLNEIKELLPQFPSEQRPALHEEVSHVLSLLQSNEIEKASTHVYQLADRIALYTTQIDGELSPHEDVGITEPHNI